VKCLENLSLFTFHYSLFRKYSGELVGRLAMRNQYGEMLQYAGVYLSNGRDRRRRSHMLKLHNPYYRTQTIWRNC